MPAELRDTTWTELAERCLLVVPLGSLEQHGPHLPLVVDSLVADAVARGLSEGLAARGVANVVGPVVPYGASGEHQGFPGTVSIGTEALRLLLVELARSATEWASGVVFVSGHGGNVDALEQAVALLREEGRVVCWTGCGVPGADAHAGRTETSAMLHLAPWSVRSSRMSPGATAPVSALMERLREEGVRSVSPTGVLGDPRGASGAEGAQLVAAMVDRACEVVMASLGEQAGWRAEVDVHG